MMCFKCDKKMSRIDRWDEIELENDIIIEEYSLYHCAVCGVVYDSRRLNRG